MRRALQRASPTRTNSCGGQAHLGLLRTSQNAYSDRCSEAWVVSLRSWDTILSPAVTLAAPVTHSVSAGGVASRAGHMRARRFDNTYEETQMSILIALAITIGLLVSWRPGCSWAPWQR